MPKLGYLLPTRERVMEGQPETGPLLESLAVVTEVSQTHLDVRWLQEGGHSGLLVAVLGAVTEHDKPALVRMRHSAAGAMALALDVNAWTRTGTAEPDTASAGWLKAHGWKAATAGPRDPVPTLWQELGLATRTKDSRVPRNVSQAGHQS